MTDAAPPGGGWTAAGGTEGTGSVDRRAAGGTGVVGVVLAAGAGRRFGGPKALARTDDGVPWLVRAVEAVRAGGVPEVVVALGARAREAETLVPDGVPVVQVDGWEKGVSESLAAVLDALPDVLPGAVPGAVGAVGGADAMLVTLVDLPDLNPEAVRRVLDGRRAGTADVGGAPGSRPGRGALRRATYGGVPGHPVLVGRDHWAALRASLAGDVGAGPYLRAHGAVEVDCSDLGGGDDVDHRRGA